MRSIERRFNRFRKANHYWSAFICFAETIKGMGFTRPVVGKHFYRLVPKDDYEWKFRRTIVNQLYGLSIDKKIAEEGVKKG